MIDYQYDFFLAHAGPDTQIAEQLFDLLSPAAQVFLDSRSLILGDEWDLAIPAAQMQSRVTIVLVTTNSPAAFYERDEIRAAISLARSRGGKHRVVPIFESNDCLRTEGAHYGLRLKHGITLSPHVTLLDAATKLLSLLAMIKKDKQSSPSSARTIIIEPKRQNLGRDTTTTGLAVIHQYFRSRQVSRIHVDQASKLLSSTLNLSESECRELLQNFLDKGFLTSASGNRIELSLSGLRLVTTGGLK